MKNFQKITNELYGAKKAGYKLDTLSERETDELLVKSLKAKRGARFVEDKFDSLYDLDGDLYEDETGNKYAVVFVFDGEHEVPLCWQKLTVAESDEKAAIKRSEAIAKYQSDLSKAMAERYRIVLDSYGRIQYKVYVWEDGEIECLEGVQGDNTRLQAKEMEPRKLFYVCTIDSPCFDPWDYSDHSAPDDEAERETERQEIIDYLVDEYERNISDLLDEIITEAERDEKYGY